MDTTSPAVKSILLIITIVVVIGLFTGLTNPVVRVLLGFAEESTLDDGTKEKYNYLRDINIENINSINALLFSINSIAHYDTNLKTGSEKEKFLKTMFSDDRERVFGNQKVKYTYSNIETIFFEKEDSKELIAQKLIDYSVKCFFIFEDNGQKRTRCFQFDTTDLTATGISETFLVEQAQSYKDSGYCDDKCKEKVDEIFLGKFFDKFDLATSVSTGKELYLCVEPKVMHASHPFADKVFITDKLSHHACNSDDKVENVIGFKVLNFNMKQDIGPITDIKKFVQGYKPNIFYYEVADERITDDFSANIFEFNAGEVIAWELLFFVIFDAFPMGRQIRQATGAHLVLKQAVKEGFEEAAEREGRRILQEAGEAAVGKKSLKQIYSTFKEKLTQMIGGIKKVPREILERIFVRGLGKVTNKEIAVYTKKYMREEVQTVAQKTVKEIVEKGSEDIGGEVIQKISQRYSSRLSEIVQEIMTNPKYYDASKRELSDVGKQQIDTLFKSVDYGDLASGLTPGQMKTVIGTFKSLDDTYKNHLGKTFFSKVGYLVKRQSRIFGKFMQKMDTILLRKMSKDEQELFLKQLFEEDAEAFFKGVSNKDMQRFLANQKFSFDEIDELVGKENIETILRNIDDTGLEIVSSNAKAATIERSLKSEFAKRGGLNPFQRKKYVILATIWALSSLNENDADIFHPVGVNSFGYKQSLSTPVIFDEILRTEWDYSTSQGKIDFNKYFKYYANSVILGKTEREEKIDPETGIDYEAELYQSEKYTGTIPQIYNYFISLAKDKRRFWFDQPPERFYLIAPCNADLNVRLTQIECFSKPNEANSGINTPIGQFFDKAAKFETGTFNHILDRKVEHFDGQNSMLYQVDENGDIIKICDPQNFFESISPFDNPYTPTTIEIDPILDRSIDMNYCFEGIDDSQLVAKGVFHFGFPMLGYAVGSTIPGPGTFIGGFIGSAFGSIMYELILTGAINPLGVDIVGERWHWPYHDSKE